MDESKVTLEDLTPVRKRLQVEIPAEAVQAELERTFQAVGRQARLRGFRPGKAPRSVLERMFGADVRRDVVDRLVEESFHHAVESHRLDVIGAPEIEAEALAPGEVLRYSATVEVRPTIVLGDLRGIQVTRPTATVAEEDVDRMLAALRESVAQLRPVEDRIVVEPGDVVTVDLTSRLDGGEPARREGVLLEAGGGSFPLALERQLVGQHRGAHLSLRVPYPPDHANPGLAGKVVELDVEVKDLRVKELPALDDDFARDHGRCESLAELRARVRRDLEREAIARADDAVRGAVLEQLLVRHPLDVPPSLVDRRVEALVAGLDVRPREEEDRDAALAAVRSQLRPRAERQVAAELLLDAVAVRDGVEVSEAEVTAAVDEIAAGQHDVVERVRGLYAKPEARAALRAKLVRDRALASIVERARVVPQSAGESVADEK